jgi:hypothetical protein
MTKKIKKGNLFRAVMVAAFAVLLWMYFSAASTRLVLDRDEISWFFHIEFFEQLFIKRNLDTQIWTSYESYDHPQLSKFLFGGYLWFRDPDIFAKRDALAREYGRWRFYFDPRTSDISNTEFAPILGMMRELNVWFTIGTVLVCGYILSFLGLPVILIVLMMLALSYNPLFQLSMIRGTADAQVIFFLFLALALYIRYGRTQSQGHLPLIAVTVAMAVSSKLTGFVGAVSYVAWEFILLTPTSPIKMIFKRMGLMLLLMFSCWIMLNPALYSDPLRNSFEYFAFRYRQSVILQQSFPDIALWTFKDKWHAIHCTLFTAHCGPLFKSGYLFPNPVVSYMFLLAGIVHLIRGATAKNMTMVIFLVFLYIIILMVGFYLPINSDRYYLPLLLMNTMVQFSGIQYLFQVCNIRRHNILRYTKK